MFCKYMNPALLVTTVLVSLVPGLLPLAAQDAADNEPATQKTDPPVEKLGDGKFKVGLVQFDSNSRHVTFPCTVNMTEGKLEYAIVHEDGKIHESILSTRIDALNLNIAMKLLRFKGSPELFQILDEDYKPTGKYPEIPEEQKAASRVEILVSWTDAGGTAHSAALNDWITHEQTKKPVPAAPWVYGGSYLHRGVFQAKAMGDIAAIFTARAALFNYPGKDRENDEVWIPTPNKIPPVGTPVTVTIKPPLTN